MYYICFICNNFLPKKYYIKKFLKKKFLLFIFFFFKNINLFNKNKLFY